ncbi:T6SS phospholipase effector Tle1-like catalytic domain-containing protein [Rhodotorula paludigena]|uniref:T6SS phospholipase effector Tle1-like catalytic domain-containing protein n=1 Tax=Rhodotorula paludigena TaxID=86838 RepID=UPI003171D9E5
MHALPPPFEPRPSYVRCAPRSRASAAGGRRLICCFDGTGNAFGTNITNVPTLFSLASEDPDRQLLYYQTGIGTAIGTHEAIWTPGKVWQKISETVDEGIAWSLGQHICAGYQFLMNHWRPGDEIFLLGFSRGAYTARALAGMLQQVGLLPAGNEESIPLAFSIYKRKANTPLVPEKETLAEGFKRTFSRDVEVHFVGVWDTVASVGAIIPRTLPFANSSTFIHIFRQALALDEGRARYNPQHWIHDPPSPGADRPPTDVKEVWFTGAHSNVGGGEFPYTGDVNPALSHLSLRWMLREAVEAGFEVDSSRIATSPIFAPFVDRARMSLDGPDDELDPALRAYLAKARDANDSVNEVMAATVFLAALPSPEATADALAPRANHLGFSLEERSAEEKRKRGLGGRLADWWSRMSSRAMTLFWWTLELSPTIKVRWDAEGNRRHVDLRANRGRGRVLPPNPLFHFSVRERLNARGAASFGGGAGNNENFPEGEQYHIMARFKKGRGMAEVRFVE